jgi:dienelactone hydrolase
MRLAELSTKAAPMGAALLFLVVVLAACATPDRFGGSRQAVLDWSRARGFAEQPAASGRFRLLTLVRGGGGERVSIYIEGDGAAWATPYHPPGDPTPTRPVALALAAADPGAAIAYLGRPCQYLDATALQDCDRAYWSGKRFAAEVVAVYDEAINGIKRGTGARRIALFGYSGGGVIAALLAARRDDVERLVTVAAPLATAEWTTWHGVSPLSGSLDPADMGENVRLPRAVHFVGADDRIVPAVVVERFVQRSGGRIEVIPGFDHDCCWSRDWGALLGRVSLGGAK